MAKLLIQESNGTREFELVDLEVNIGRELDNSLRLADPSISRHHAVLRKTPAGYEIQDLGSSNGVLINGVKVEAGPLKDGDRVTLGQMQLTFTDPQPGTVNPLGTVRMNLDDMAKLQAAAAVPAAPEAPLPPPPPPAPLPPPPPPAPQAYAAPAPVPAGVQPPAFLAPYLPPVPDDAQPVMAGGAIERGDFGTRFLACLIDQAILVILGIAYNVLLAMLGPGALLLGFIGCFMFPVLGLGYMVFQLWCLVSFRATIGKKIMKLRVVPESNPAANIDWTMALLRLAGHLVNSMLAGLPYLLILGDERKGFQDMFSGSVVIKVDR